MWIYQAAKQVQEKVQERATSIVAQVQDEAQLLLKTMSQAQTNPVDEIIFEELDDYKAFQEVFDLDLKTDDVASILQKDEFIADLHTALVPEQLAYKEFWTRYYFRQFLQLQQEEEQAKRDEERRVQLEKEREARELHLKEAAEASAQAERDRAEQQAKEMDVQIWKDQVASLQEVISSLESADASNHQLLADDYETKLTQMTTQIDDARAVGYEEGIAESEQIVKSIRDSAQLELKEFEAYMLTLATPSNEAMPPPPLFVSTHLAQTIWALHATSRDGPSTAPVPQDDRLSSDVESLRRENDALKKVAESAQEGLKELDMWKARAVKMKKLKDETDAAAKKHDDELKAAIATAFEDGLSKGKAAMAFEIDALHAKLEQHQAEIAALTQKLAPSSAAGPVDAVLTPGDAGGDDGAADGGRRGDDWGEWD